MGAATGGSWVLCPGGISRPRTGQGRCLQRGLTSGSRCVSKYQAIILRHAGGYHDAGSTAHTQNAGEVGVMWRHAAEPGRQHHRCGSRSAGSGKRQGALPAAAGTLPTIEAGSVCRLWRVRTPAWLSTNRVMGMWDRKNPR